MEGIRLVAQRDIYVSFDTPEVAQTDRHLLLRQSFLSVQGRNDEVARDRDFGSVDHDVVDGTVECLGIQVDVINQGTGIDGRGFVLGDGLSFFIRDRDIIGEFQDRAREGLGVSPACRNFVAAFGGSMFAL